MPIVYDKLFALMEAQNVSKYRLVRKDGVIGTATLDKLRRGEGHIDTRSLERLCDYLKCQPGDIMEFVPAAQEREEGENRDN